MTISASSHTLFRVRRGRAAGSSRLPFLCSGFFAIGLCASDNCLRDDQSRAGGGLQATTNGDHAKGRCDWRPLGTILLVEGVDGPWNIIASHDLGPGRVMDAGRETPRAPNPGDITQRYRWGWDETLVTFRARGRLAPRRPSGHREGRIAPPLCRFNLRPPLGAVAVVGEIGHRAVKRYPPQPVPRSRDDDRSSVQPAVLPQTPLAWPTAVCGC